MKRTLLVAALIVIAAGLVGAAQTRAPLAQAAPDPQVEYLYDVAGRRHYDFPNNDALGYGSRDLRQSHPWRELRPSDG